MDPKLTMLFLLIGTIVGLSHLGERRQPQRQRALRVWRRLLPVWRKD